MGDILPDGSIQGYSSICPKCRKLAPSYGYGEIDTEKHKCFRIWISDIRIGETFKHLPSGKVEIFEREDQLAWDVINQQNYSCFVDDLDGRNEYNAY